MFKDGAEYKEETCNNNSFPAEGSEEHKEEYGNHKYRERFLA